LERAVRPRFRARLEAAQPFRIVDDHELRPEIPASAFFGPVSAMPLGGIRAHGTGDKKTYQMELRQQFLTKKKRLRALIERDLRRGGEYGHLGFQTGMGLYLGIFFLLAHA